MPVAVPGRLLRIRLFVRLHLGVPLPLLLDPIGNGLPHVLSHRVGHVKRLLTGPAEILLREPQLLFAEGCSVRVRRALLVGTSVADVRLHEDERRPVRLGLGRRDRRVDRVEVFGVLDLLNVPVVGPESSRHILGEGQIRRPVDRDIVGVVQVDELPEAEMPRQRRRLVGDALHEVAVRADAVRVVVDDRVLVGVELVGQHPLRERHAHAVGEPLSEGAGRGLHAGRHPKLRMSRRLAAPLPKVLNLLQGQVVPRQVQETVEQHRRVPGREHESVPIRPLRKLRAVLQVPRPQHIGHRGQPHRRARMAALGGLHGIGRQKPNGVDALRVEIGGVQRLPGHEVQNLLIDRSVAGTHSRYPGPDGPRARPDAPLPDTTPAAPPDNIGGLIGSFIRSRFPSTPVSALCVPTGRVSRRSRRRPASPPPIDSEEFIPIRCRNCRCGGRSPSTERLGIRPSPEARPRTLSPSPRLAPRLLPPARRRPHST